MKKQISKKDQRIINHISKYFIHHVWGNAIGDRPELRIELKDYYATLYYVMFWVLYESGYDREYIHSIIDPFRDEYFPNVDLSDSPLYFMLGGQNEKAK